MSDKLKKTTFSLFFLRILKTFVSIITLTFSAKYFGVSVERDFWILTSTFIGTLNSALWGPIDEVFRAKFVLLRENEGEDVALKKTKSLLGFIIVVTLVLSILLSVFSEQISFLLSPNITYSSRKILIKLFLLIIPTFLVNQVISLCICVLNSYEVYYIPEVVSFLAGIINLISIIFFAPLVGIYSLVISQYASIFILFLIIIYYLNKINIQLWHNVFHINWEYVWVFIAFAIPFFFPYFVGQSNILVEKRLAGTLGNGVISILDYSRQFSSVLQAVLCSVLTTIMVPVLSKYYARNDIKKFTFTLRQNIQICFFILSFSLPILIGAARPLCRLFFLRGNISPNVVDEITILSCLYSSFFIGVTLYLLFGLSMLSCGQSNKYAFIGVITQLLILVVNICFYKIGGVYTFPLSYGIMHLFSAIVLFLSLNISDKITLFVDLLKYILIIIFSAIIVYITNCLYYELNALVLLFINILIVLFVSLFSSNLFGLKIAKNIAKRLYRK